MRGLMEDLPGAPMHREKTEHLCPCGGGLLRVGGQASTFHVCDNCGGRWWVL